MNSTNTKNTTNSRLSTHSFWKDKRVVVTDGAGFIGSYLVERSVKEGQRVRVIDNLSTGRRENIEPFLPEIEFIGGDIRAPGLVIEAMDGVDYVLHQAAVPSRSPAR